MTSNAPNAISRVGAANADLIDKHVQIQLNDELNSVLHSLRSLKLDADSHRDELELLLRCFVWWTSVRQYNSTIGQRLLRLQTVQVDTRTAPSGWRTLCVLLCTEIVPWIYERLSRRSNSQSPIEKVRTLYRALDILNYLIFLRQGVYMRLWQRMLGIVCVGAPADMFRHHNFEFMNEELLYFAASECVSFVLPSLPHLRNMRTYAKRKWQEHWKQFSTNSTLIRNEPILKKCAICGQSPFNPHEFNECAHVYCYYCIHAVLAEDRLNGFYCDRCSARLTTEQEIRQVKIMCN